MELHRILNWSPISCAGETKRGRSFADHASPRQLQAARLDERSSNAGPSRRSSKVSKWDIQADVPDAVAEQEVRDTVPGPPTDMQRRTSVEEGECLCILHAV